VDGLSAALESMLRDWFPPPAYVAAAAIADCPMHPEEAALVANAVERRRHEFATGRRLARAGLRALGMPESPLLMGSLRAPLWPDPLVGAITHDGALCAIVLRAGPAGAADGVGIDLVHLPPRSGRMEELAPMFVSHGGEVDAARAFGLEVDPLLLLFSLKESALKALARRLDAFVDLRDIAIDPARGVSEPRLGLVAGRFHAAVAGNYLLTAMSRAPDIACRTNAPL
jgi:4'-phosphopantetheinyl transferase EntD